MSRKRRVCSGEYIMEMSVSNTYNGKSLAATISESIANKISNFSEPATHCNKRGWQKERIWCREDTEWWQEPLIREEFVEEH